MSDNKTIDNVHVHIYGHEMLGEVISRARKNNIPYDKDMYYDFHSHGHVYLVHQQGQLTLVEDPTPNHSKEGSLNDLFELYFSKEEVKKELEIGKWYRCTEKSALFFVQEINDAHVYAYGFDYLGGWNDLIYWMNLYDYHDLNRFTEATPQEVESALIEEAKRIGFKGGFVFDDRTNILWNQQENGEERAILSNGQWANIIEEDKFAELKEAHSNGAVIESMPKKWIGDWTVATNPIWDGDNYEYRIKPEEKPKVGDVCKFWNEYENVFIVGIYAELRDRNDQWDDNNTHIHGVRLGANYYTKFFKHAKTLTRQEVNNLLFGKENVDD